MTYVQLNIEDAMKARDAGIEKAVTHANQVTPDWSERAFELLKHFLQNHCGQFQCEEIRAFAAMVDFPLPPSARSWGHIMVRAMKEGLIRMIDNGPTRNKKAHRARAGIYISNKT